MRKRVLSIWLSVCMVLTMLPISAMAEEVSTPASASGEVIAFAPLAETEKSVEVGTPIEKLKLPESLTATVRTAVPADSVIPEEPVLDSGESEDDVPLAVPALATTTSAIKESGNDRQESPAPEWKESTVEIPVTWTAEPEYNGNENGDYVFTPVIEGYTVSADLPEITVTVGAKPLMMALRGGAPTTYGDFSVSIEEDGAAPTFDESSRTLTFSVAGEYTVGMADDKTSTSNVIVVSASDVTLNLDGVSIEAPDGSAAKVDGGNALTVTSDSVILNLLNDNSFTGGIGGIVDPLNACNGGSGISGNITVTGTASLTATGGIGGAAIGDTGTGGTGISGNVTVTNSASLIAVGGQYGGANAKGGTGISGNLTVTGSATVSATGGDGAPMAGTPGNALGGTLTATSFILKGGFTGLTDEITNSDSRLNQFRYISVKPVPNVAEIGSTGYPTLQAAVDAVGEGETIKLADNITITDSSSITISGANSFTLDLNGKTLADDGSGSTSLIKHSGSGTLTIEDGDTGGKIASSRTASDNTTGNVGTVELFGGNGALTLLSGTIENTSANGAGIVNYGTGTVNIHGGSVKAEASGINNKSGNVSVSGGVIEANGYRSAAIVSSAGKVTLSGGIIYHPTYVGVGLSNSSLVVSGGSPVIQGGTAAMNVAPTVDSDTIGKVTASTSYDGSNPVENYDAGKITTYKYLTFAVKVTPTAAEYAADAVSDTDYVLDNTNKTLTIKTAKGAAFWSASGTTYLDYTVLLANDIDVSGFLWTPVGNGSGAPFEGSFDGHEHSITGLTVTAANNAYAGLFGGTQSATIQNLCVSGTIEVTEADSSLYMGGIVGIMGNGSIIRNCCSHVAISGTASDEVDVGGIVGLLNSGTIENCFSTGDLSGTGADTVIAGGIYGAISTYNGDIGMVKNSYNTGSVSGSGSSITFLGALGGAVDRKIVLENCYYLSGAASAAFGSGSSANVGSFTAGTTDTLLASLHSWVSGQASTAYRTWQADNAGSPVNDGYPVFGDLWGTTTPVFDNCFGTVTTEKNTDPDAGNEEYLYTFAGWYTAPNGEGTRLGDNESGAIGTRYYAKWIKNEKTVRTTALDLRDIGESKTYGATKNGVVYTNAAEGWTWYATNTTVNGVTYAANTLVLSGLTVHTAASAALSVPAGTTVVLTEGTANVLYSGYTSTNDEDAYTYGLYGAGDLNLRGGGSLNAVAGRAENIAKNHGCSSSGIYSEGTLTVSDAVTVTARGGIAAGGNEGSSSAGIFGKNAITVAGGTVTAAGSSADVSFGIYCGYDENSSVSGTVVITGGTVTATGGYASIGGTSVGLYGMFALSVSGGTVTATGGNTGSNGSSIGIYCGYEKNSQTHGTLVISGGTVTAKTGSTSLSLAVYACGTLTVGSTEKMATIANATDGSSSITTSSGDIGSKMLLMSDTTAVGITFPTYAITANSATNGSYTTKVNGSTAASAQFGDTVTITPAASNGYELNTITVTKTGDTETTVPVTNGTFTMPAYAVTVSVTFKVSSTPTYTISGTIKGSDTSAGIPASLQLKNSSGNVGSAVTAAADGSYSLTGVPAGSYTIAVSHTGYDSGTITGITVSNSTITGADLTLTKTISGLTDAQKLAAAQAAIMAAINRMSFSNSTTAADILSIAQTASLYGVTVAWDTANGFTKTQATASDKGSIRGTLRLTLNQESGGIGIDAAIDKLSTGGDNGGGSGNGGGASGSSSTPSPSTKPTEPVTGSTENKAAVDNKGNANVILTDKNITDAIADAKAEAAKKGVNAGDITAVIHVTTDGKDASTVTVNLPKTTQEQVIGNKISSVELVIDRPDLTIGINLAAVTEINWQAKADVQLSAIRMDNAKLTGGAKAAIGSRPVYDLKATYGNGKSVTDFGKGSVSVEISYTLQKGEVAGNIYAVYVDANGKVTYLTDSSYDAKRGTVVFSTSHFSTYGIAYKASFNFTDINGHWAKEDILFAANRGILIGTSSTTFSPNASMTRGMFVTALGRLANADISAYKKSSFSDVKTGAYYMGYIEWGVKNNILVGIGGGKFDPDGLVTREQMAVIMDRYATAIGFKLPEVHTQNTFADNAKIGTWAAPSVKRIQMAGIIQGKNNNFYDPQGTATRSEASAVLRRFVELMIFNSTAQGWVKNDSGQWMFFKDGKALTGWQTVAGKVYCFDKSGGAFANGWRQNAKGEWFFLSPDGSAATGWKDIGASGNVKRYYFDADGVMVAGKWLQIDGYEVDENGVRKTK